MLKGTKMKAFYEKRNSDVSLYKSETVSFDTHFHPEIEVIVMTNGRAECMIDGCTYEVSSGEAIVVFPNHIHSYVDKTSVENAVLIFKTAVLPEFKRIFQEFVPSSPIVQRAVLERNGFYKIWETVLEEYNSSKQIQKGWLLVLMGKLFEGCELVKQKSFHSDITIDILNYCESNYHDNISLKSTARALHISESRLSHIFSEKLKMSFCNYVNMLRVNEAVNLLDSTEYSITEIAGLCGFSTIRTFNRAFLKQMGTSPVKYRKQYPYSGAIFL